MKTISTFNALHLGDNLIHLHFLRKLATRHPEILFIHGTQPQYHAQLLPLIAGLPNLQLTDIALTSGGAINAWRGAGGWFYQQPDQADFFAIHRRWFRALAQQMGLESPIECACDMLFDYPELGAPRSWHDFDFLIINGPPMSGQWHGYDPVAFGQLVARLIDAGKTVCTTEWAHPAAPFTRDIDMSVTEIGSLSTRARCIIGCVTGPMWPCLNVWNSGLSALNSQLSAPLRIHLLDSERVDLAPNTVHANSLSLVPEILQSRGLL